MNSVAPIKNRAPSLSGFIVIGTITLAVLALGIFLAINDPRSPSTLLSIFATRFLGILIEALPFLVLGTLVSGLIEAFVRQEDVLRWLPRNRYLATIGGAFMGLIFPVCECGVVPVARRLFTKGLPVSVGVAFLLAAPFMNPIVFASTFIAFGFGPIFILRFVVTAVVAITIGLIFATNSQPETLLQPASWQNEVLHGGPRRNWRDGLKRTLSVASNEFFEMGRYLYVGCLLASAMQTFVPQEALLAVGTGPILSVFIMQVLAFILSICSTVDSFFVLAFVNTFTMGSVVSFLTFGPMVDIKSTMMFMGVFKRRTVLYLILLPFVLNLLAGVLINALGGFF
ncbi:permease [Phototrophicus methaneseepsis]|uniref:Permease n=1 Tax=Phototrophicus methaneseepsis TaxID=2710758 RepID=A0A7S8E8Y4_9CHLR|nr:permease [Phototrophicus methaneseepsis]QPC82570.1 permease [Phototrophicus methaneseepsis]